MDKLNEKSATLKLILHNPETGYSCKMEEKVSPNQWGAINKILYNKGFENKVLQLTTEK